MNIFGNQKLFFPLKIILFVLMSWLIADRLFLQNNFSQQTNFFLKNFSSQNFYFFILAILLMPLNWLLETIKWRILIKSKEPFGNLFKSIIAGITLGFVTPGRTGEFIGRVLFLEEENKAKMFYLSSIGGIAQSAVTLLTGVVFVYLWSGYSFFYGVTLGVAVIFSLVYFRFDLLNRFISSNSFLAKHRLVIRAEELPEISTLIKVLLLSFVRFCVYLLQYILLLIFFGVSTDFFALLVHSGVFLVAQTFSPMLPLVDMSYRGGTALFVFNNFSTNNIGILSSVMIVWLINLVVPAMVGYLFILKKKKI